MMIEIAKISLIAFVISALIQDEQSSLTWYHNLIKRLPWWLFKPLGGCYMCFTGQVCLWFYLITRLTNYRFEYDFFDHLFFITAGIMFSMVYHKIYCYLK